MVDSGIANQDIRQAWKKAQPHVLWSDKVKITPVTLGSSRRTLTSSARRSRTAKRPIILGDPLLEAKGKKRELPVVETLEQQQLPTPVPSAESSPEPVLKRARGWIDPAKAPSTWTSELSTLRLAYEAARRDGGAAFIALDIEFWERDHDVLLEFGWSVVEFVKEDGSKKVKERRQDQHVVIEENRARRNGRYSPDARDYFDFGRTLTLPHKTVYYLLHALFSTLSSSSPVYLIFHDPRGDLRALANLGFDVERDFQHELKGLGQAKRGNEGGGVWIVDTQRLFGAWLEKKDQIGLEKACAEFKIPTERPHNAGNDAHYTLDLFERLMDRSRVPDPNSELIQMLDERARIAEGKKQQQSKREQERMEQRALGEKQRQGQELVVAEDLAQVQLPNSAPSLEASPEPVPNPARRSSVLPTADSASSPAVTSFPSTSGPTTRADVRSSPLASPAPTTASSSPELELATVRLAYETARRDGGATFHALNLELWEFDQNVLLEFGWTILEYSKDAEGKVEESRTNQHVVIKENERRRNHQYVPDARDHFDFGHTLTLRLDALKSVLRALLASLSATSPVFLIFHDPNKDLHALAKLGFDVQSEFECDLTRVPQREAGQGGVWVVDTQRLFEGWVQRRGQVGLNEACQELKVPTKHLHNPGNDAHCQSPRLLALP
ncbi:hypothetical protein JCM5296_001614 [Sporobolomyces johnsonii]